MLTSEMAKYRIQDRIGEAEAFRTSRSTRTARRAAGRSRAWRIASHALAVVLWPVKR